jgi:hypothetical protein
MVFSMVVVAYSSEATFASSMTEVEVAGPTPGVRQERHAKLLTHSKGLEKPLDLYGWRAEDADEPVPTAFYRPSYWWWDRKPWNSGS